MFKHLQSVARYAMLVHSSPRAGRAIPAKEKSMSKKVREAKAAGHPPPAGMFRVVVYFPDGDTDLFEYVAEEACRTGRSRSKVVLGILRGVLGRGGVSVEKE